MNYNMEVQKKLRKLKKKLINNLKEKVIIKIIIRELIKMNQNTKSILKMINLKLMLCKWNEEYLNNLKIKKNKYYLIIIFKIFL